MGNWTNQSLILSQRSKYCQVALMEDQSKLKIVHIESRSVGWGRPSTLSLWEAKIVSVWSRSRPGPQWKRTDFETDLPKHRFCQRQTSLWISCENLIANRLVYSLIICHKAIEEGMSNNLTWATSRRLLTSRAYW